VRGATYLHPNRILNIIAAVVLAVKACEEMVMGSKQRRREIGHIQRAQWYFGSCSQDEMTGELA
jgi:hypothetical protein